MTYEGACDAVTFLGRRPLPLGGAYQVLNGRLSRLAAWWHSTRSWRWPTRPFAICWCSGINLQRCDVLLNRVDDVLQQEPEQGHDRSALRPVPSLAGHVTLSNVGFRYGGPEAPAILRTRDPRCARRQSGRHRRPQRLGEDDCSPSAWPVCSSRPKGTILLRWAGPQDVELPRSAAPDRVRAAGFVRVSPIPSRATSRSARTSRTWTVSRGRRKWPSASEFVTRLPFGYDTRIGETGLALSGGQRQRIAIARAVYNRPPILIFDEATSSLDAESERAVQQNIDSALLEGRTAFVIAHRMSTVQNADVIIVIERGRLVEQGTHDESDRAARPLLLSGQPAAWSRCVGMPGSTDVQFLDSDAAAVGGPRALAWVLLALFGVAALALILVQSARDGRRTLVLVSEHGLIRCARCTDGIVTGVSVA